MTNFGSIRLSFLVVLCIVSLVSMTGCGVSSGGGAADNPVAPEVVVDGVDGKVTVAGSAVLAPTLKKIQILPSPLALTIGATSSLKALGTYSDNSSKDVSAQVTWTSAKSSVASVQASTGVVKGLVAGTTTITAKLSGISGTTIVTVAAPEAVLKTIQVTPSPVVLEKGSTQQFLAAGIYGDGSTKDLTGTVTWTSSKTGVATIGANSGLVQTVDTGKATIIAVFGGITGTAELTVQTQAPSLTKIQVSAALQSIVKDAVLSFKATGTYSDGSTKDLTGTVTWSSSVTAVATINAKTGQAKGVASGTTKITATLGGMSGSTSLAVTPPAPTLKRIQVTPAGLTIKKNATQAFKAAGIYSDNSSRDITSTVSWSSGTTKVATINAKTGVAKGIGAGSTTITATLKNVSGATSLTVK